MRIRQTFPCSPLPLRAKLISELPPWRSHRVFRVVSAMNEFWAWRPKHIGLRAVFSKVIPIAFILFRIVVACAALSFLVVWMLIELVGRICYFFIKILIIASILIFDLYLHLVSSKDDPGKVDLSITTTTRKASLALIETLFETNFMKSDDEDEKETKETGKSSVIQRLRRIKESKNTRVKESEAEEKIAKESKKVKVNKEVKETKKDKGNSGTEKATKTKESERAKETTEGEEIVKTKEPESPETARETSVGENTLKAKDPERAKENSGIENPLKTKEPEKANETSGTEKKTKEPKKIKEKSGTEKTSKVKEPEKAKEKTLKAKRAEKAKETKETEIDSETCEAEETKETREIGSSYKTKKQKSGAMSRLTNKLTEDGVRILYDIGLKATVNMQVIYLVVTPNLCYLRLSDGKRLTPVLGMQPGILNPVTFVGSVIAVNGVQYISADSLKLTGNVNINMTDTGLLILCITSYTVIVSTVDKTLGHIDQTVSYKDSINYVLPYIKKYDHNFRYIDINYKKAQKDASKIRERGNNLFSEGKYEEALELYDTAKGYDAFDYRLWSNSSQALFHLREYSDAEEEALVSVKLNPFNDKAHYWSGQAALKQGKYTDASHHGGVGQVLCGTNSKLQQMVLEADRLEEENEQKKVMEIKDNKAKNNKSKKNSSGKQTSNNRHDDEENVDPNMMKNVEEEVERQKKDTKKSKKGKASNEEVEEENRKELILMERSTKAKNIYYESLKDGRKFYETSQFKQALEMFAKVLAYACREGDQTAISGLSGCQDLLEIQFIVGACKVQATLNDIFDGMEIMKRFSVEKTSLQVCAATHYFMALGYERLCLRKTAQQESVDCSILLKSPDNKSFRWPGSEDFFQDSVPLLLKSRNDDLHKKTKHPCDQQKCLEIWRSLPLDPTFSIRFQTFHKFEEKYSYMEMIIKVSIEKHKRESLGRFSRGDHSSGYIVQPSYINGELLGKASSIKPKPKAKCRFKDCIPTQGHSNAKEDIYDTDPDFKGNVDVICEESCTVTYHPCCWKAHKDQAEEQFGKMSDKDFLGTECVTPDCAGKINAVLIYDETSNLKHELNKDKKNAPTPVKQKKKKDKKKAVAAKVVLEAKDKKKSKQESEEQGNSEETVGGATATAATIKSEVASKPTNSVETTAVKEKTPQPVSNLPIDAESLDKVKVVIKPTVEEEVAPTSKSSKKKKNKNKKQKEILVPDLISDPIEDDINNTNGYVARLRALKQQRDAQESDDQTAQRPANSAQPVVNSVANVSQWLDPDNPFYLPQHLRDNPEELERVLQTKMITSSSPNLDSNTITVLLEFVYEWLKSQGPMSINDERLRQYVAENFHREALDHVNQCGGIKQFLMQSIDFAMIDEVICVRDHVVRAQDLTKKTVCERMLSSRFLISDGRKAKKFSHLVDDTKSTCSSSSSTSPFVCSEVSSRTTSESNIPVTKAIPKVEVDYRNAKPKPATGTMSGLDTFCAGDILTTAKPMKSTPTKGGLSGLDTFEIPSPKSAKSKLKFSQLDSFDSNDMDEYGELDKINESGDDAPWQRVEYGKTIALSAEPKTTASNQNKSTFKNQMETKSIVSKSNNAINTNRASSMSISSQAEEDEEESYDESEDEEEDDSVDDSTTRFIESLKEEMEQMKNEMKVITHQNQKLNDKLIQVKSSSTTEIASLKRKLEELTVEKRDLESEKQSLSGVKESEARKFKVEMSRMQDEVRSFQGRNNSLEHKFERTNDRLNEIEGRLAEEREISGQLREEVKNLQESLTSSSRRAHEAEVKYLCVKKDLTEKHLNGTIDRLTAEVLQMRQLLHGASDDSIPDRATLTRSIVSWDDYIKSLRDRKTSFMEEAKRMLGMVNQGRPLNALPPGDLTIPSVPDINIAHLLVIVPNAKRQQMIPPPNLEFIQEQQYGRNHSPLLPPPHPTLTTVPAPPTVTPTLPAESQVTSITLNGAPGFDLQKLSLQKAGNMQSPFNGGAIPKVSGASPGSYTVTTTDGMAAQKYPDANKIFIGKIPWECNESDIKKLFSDLVGEVVGVTVYDKGFTPDGKAVPKYGFVTFRHADDQQKALNYGPIMIGNHVLNIQAKEAKKPITKPMNMPPVGVPIMEPVAIKTESSAYGLSDISLIATSEVRKSEVRSLATTPINSTTPVTKPKFQNLSTNSSMGAIGALPPKLVRPQPKQPTGGKVGAASSPITSAGSKEDSFAYKKLIEVCKSRIGKEFSSPDICSALREVRMKNNQSLSGLTVDMIVERVKMQLRARRPGSGQATIAPWASLTQGASTKAGGPDWQGPASGEIPLEEQCSICLDALNSSPTLQLQCKHVFHEKCIGGWLKRQSNCPNCRTFALMADEYPSLKH